MRISDWSSDVCSSDLLDPELVEGIDAKQHGIGENAMLVEGDQRAQAARGHLVEQDGRRGPVARIIARAIRARATRHQRRALRDAIGDQRFVMRSAEHTYELQSLKRISYAVFWLQK